MDTDVADVSDPMTDAVTDEPTSAEGAWGRIFVTRRCCGAGSCRNYAPELFGEVGTEPEHPSAVLPDSHEPGAFTGALRQPRSAQDHADARRAAAGCAFGAIRLEAPAQKLPSEHRGSPWKDWPRAIEPGVWALGQPSKRNYGAMAYFIERPGGGVLVDLPKPSKRLFAWLEAHGGVRHLFITHADHAQHHAEFAAHFPDAKRVLGRADVNRFAHAYADATTDVEVQLPSDQGPVALDGNPIPLEALADAEIALLPQPGHTAGGFCLLYRGRYLFTGDHLSYNRLRGHLVGHRMQCWQDWERLTAAVDELAGWARAGHLRFVWVLPGHGGWHRFEEGTAAEALARSVTWLRAQPPGRVSLLRWVPYVISRTEPKGRWSRLANALGGKQRDAWLLPAAVRRYLPDHGRDG